MFHKFKTTTYATLLLIGVFVLPYAGNVAEVSAENYGCKGSKKEVRQCLKAVISERDKTIVELQTRSDPRGPTDLRHPDICTTGSAEDQERCIHEMRMQVDSREKEIRTVLHGPPPTRSRARRLHRRSILQLERIDKPVHEGGARGYYARREGLQSEYKESE